MYWIVLSGRDKLVYAAIQPYVRKSAVHQHRCINKMCNVYVPYVNTDSALLLSLFFYHQENTEKNDLRKKNCRKVWMTSNPVTICFCLSFRGYFFLLFDCYLGKLDEKKRKKDRIHNVYQILREQKIDFVSLAINFNSNGSMSRFHNVLSPYIQQWFVPFVSFFFLHPFARQSVSQYSTFHVGLYFVWCVCEGILCARMIKKLTIHFDKACNAFYDIICIAEHVAIIVIIWYGTSIVHEMLYRNACIRISGCFYPFFPLYAK